MGSIGLESGWTKWLGLTLCLTAGACDSEDLETFQELELRSGGTLSGGGGGFINNGLDDPQLSGLDPAHSLETNAGLKASSLKKAERLATARYVVECALPAGESVVKSVNGTNVMLQGALGLAPEWQDDACDEDCQEWITACLLARTNVSGQTVGLWLKGDHPALGFGSSPSYPNYEASFFGNVFANGDDDDDDDDDDDKAYLCVEAGSGPVLAQLNGRTCSNADGNWCGFTAYTGCEQAQRCEFVESDSTTVAMNCRPGVVPSGMGMHTISTYVATPN